MKCTLNIDSALLDRVVEITGAPTKTEAIHIALREVDRRARLVEEVRAGMGASSDDEIRGLFGPSPKGQEVLRVAEDATPYTTDRPKTS
jgi:Arc/MetJ family transcription regulator